MGASIHKSFINIFLLKKNVTFGIFVAGIGWDVAWCQFDYLRQS